MGKYLGKNEVSAWIANNNPGDFLDAAPEYIAVGGIPFTWFSGVKCFKSANNVRYVNSYQSAIQADNGEWPVFEVVVNYLRRKNTSKCVFDTSTLGTGLK